ncbi:MAG: MFS transporter, partial [Candidatus Dormibacteraeota bacterium]|nr:MFS transporter [Candidatus Dormibacteraeota bacterium]
LMLLPMPLASMATAPFAGRLADRIGSKYLTMGGMAGFALGMALIDWEASTSTGFWSLLPGAVVSGLGMGFTFAPLVTAAMRDVPGPLAGAASGFYNTIRQLGGAIGGAVVGAVLEVQLSASLHAQAVAQSAWLPAEVRAAFVKAFTNAGSGVLRGGPPAGVSGGHLPPEVAAQLAHLGQKVFELGYLDAMRPTLLVPIAALLAGSLAAFALRRKPAAAAPDRSQEEPPIAAAR